MTEILEILENRYQTMPRCLLSGCNEIEINVTSWCEICENWNHERINYRGTRYRRPWARSLSHNTRTAGFCHGTTSFEIDFNNR